MTLADFRATLVVLDSLLRQYGVEQYPHTHNSLLSSRQLVYNQYVALVTADTELLEF